MLMGSNDIGRSRIIVWLGDTPKSCINFGLDMPGMAACNDEFRASFLDGLEMTEYQTNGGKKDD
jgi:hypothetical protein